MCLRADTQFDNERVMGKNLARGLLERVDGPNALPAQNLQNIDTKASWNAAAPYSVQQHEDP